MDPLLPTDPRTIGPFRVDGRIGAGGMGQVYLGTDPHGRRAAIKVAHSELASDERFRERFRREIRMASTIPGWFTAAVLAADPDAAPPWLATAYVEGPSLQERVRDGGPLPPQEVAALGARLAAGLAIVHATGLVHRDLKPPNVILSAHGPRLIDFGIARGLDAAGLTGTGNLMGTPSFMSPEQATGARDVGPYSDVFALGALLVFATSGVVAVRGEHGRRHALQDRQHGAGRLRRARTRARHRARLHGPRPHGSADRRPGARRAGRRPLRRTATLGHRPADLPRYAPTPALRGAG